MLTLLPAAVASTLLEECPEIATPADAWAYYADPDVLAMYDEALAESELWWDESCDWVYTGHGSSEERTCTTGEGVTQAQSGPYSDSWNETFVREIELPDGLAGWTRVYLRTEWHYQEAGWWTSSWEAAWSGTLQDLPADGTFQYTEQSYGWSLYEYYRTLEAPNCSWHSMTDRSVDSPDLYVSFSGTGHTVTLDPTEDCGIELYEASFDDEYYGIVSFETWESTDGDGDGMPAEHDCDDADPLVQPCADEVAFDGIDQDCDGSDSFDGDGDGYDAASAGGTDCDDTSASAYPGADDPPDDAVDQDCDGADDVDADGDGYTADGDDRDADCDDADPETFPDSPEVEGDGVDQDCDGADDPRAAADTGERATEAAPSVQQAEGGCRTGVGPGSLLPVLFACGLVRRRT